MSKCQTESDVMENGYYPCCDHCMYYMTESHTIPCNEESFYEDKESPVSKGIRVSETRLENWKSF